ncbi:MAG: alpha/beta fold hydrolase [Deltaproteobacteria bacterium]|nr:alpha/beta fold hydrolase [Nannocystaceae bacterium]
MTQQIERFALSVPEAALDDLKGRLARTRWPDAETVTDTRQGPPLSKVRALCDHWLHAYDWRRCEAVLDRFGQYRTEIDGLGIHFLHVRSPHADALPLLLTHGWPGSVLEFRHVIDPLIHPADSRDAFHVIVPSLPGFGFSDQPTTTGWGLGRIADAWIELMRRLGYQRWVAQGGDWGAAVTMTLGYKAPTALAAIHLNMVMMQPTQEERTHATASEQAMLDAAQRYDEQFSAYSKLQATRPQSIGFSLADSPAGLAAWIYALFQDVSDSGSNPESVFSIDDMLDDIMLYWLPNTGASSARLYWEAMQAMRAGTPPGPMRTPAAISMFPGEQIRLSRRWAEARFAQLIHFNELDRGGHFAALEQPALFVDELRSAFRSLRT